MYSRRKNANIIFLQETHSTENDVKFWKSQWGDQCYFSHGTNQSAGVATLFNKFKGNVLEHFKSDDGRWIIVVIQLNNSILIMCNLYNYNNRSLARILMINACLKIQQLQLKYQNSYVILGGDYNDAPDDDLDRVPPKINSSKFKSTAYAIDNLNVIDIWRFLNPNLREYTWNNANRTLRSRIDLWLLTSNCVKYVKNVSHEYAPLSDHQAICLYLGANQSNRQCRGYWKMNSDLLGDNTFCEMVEKIAQCIFNKIDLNGIQKWEFFKFKIREMGIKRSKEINKNKLATENNIIKAIDSLLSKSNLEEDEKIQLNLLKEELDRLYTDLAKGAYVRSRSKWLEKGEKNSNYFFALEKRNQKRNNISAIKIDDKETQNSADIKRHVENFYKNIYVSKAQPEACDPFIQSIKEFIPVISEQFRVHCDQPFTKVEMEMAMKSLTKGRAPGSDGLPVEFYHHFWNILEPPLFDALNQCIARNEMSATMKQGLICLIPKPDKDLLLIENWRPITLLNVDYKILATVLARRLKKGLDEIISETQTGFMSNRHISSNIRLIFDLLDYSDFIDTQALILFLDFYKAFDTVEHHFMFQVLQAFGFGAKFISIIQMLYRNINSNVMLYPNTTSRFPVTRSVRQGCPLSPFLFILAVELLSIYIKNDHDLKGITVFGKEIKITQLADDTAIFLQDKSQVGKAINNIKKFSEVSGLELNLSKCEILCLYKCNEQTIYNINVKENVKYLGIYICKDDKERQNCNFSPKLKKTKNVFNLWTQRDLSIFGRSLLTKAEGISRFVYPALSLNVDDSVCDEINRLITNFVWKNKRHGVKRNVLTNPRESGGIELLDFKVLNHTFKIKWIKKCLGNPDSLWYFIPSNIFKEVGGLQFLLRCNYNVGKLPIKLCAFHQQALLAWKMCYKHNFSPHKCIIWNNEDITKRNKTLFLHKWVERNIVCLQDLFDNQGQLQSYECFINKYEFPITSKEFNFVVKSIPCGLRELMKAHRKTSTTRSIETINIEGIPLNSIKCTNKHIRHVLQSNNSIVPSCKFLWNSKYQNIKWQTAWLIPFKYCIHNKIRELHWKILHNIYSTNLFVSKFADVDAKCSLCNIENEAIVHLFYECQYSKMIWTELVKFIYRKTNHRIFLESQNIITYFNHTNQKLQYLINLYILSGKYHIHKAKCNQSKPCFKLLLIEVNTYLQTLTNVINKKSTKTIDVMKQFNIYDV